MDPLGSYEVVERIRKVTVERRLAVLFSTHRVDEIEALGEKVVLLHQGKVVHSGGIRELRGNLDRQRVSFRFSTPTDARNAAEVLNGSSDVEILAADGDSLTVATRAQIGQLFAALGDLSTAITSVSEERVPLREVLADVLTKSPSDGAAPV